MLPIFIVSEALKLELDAIDKLLQRKHDMKG